MKILKLVILVLISSYTNAESSPTKYLSLSDFALKVCLDDNYEKITAYKRENLRDYSSFESMTPEKQLELSDFVKKNTGNFYKENLSIHIESRNPPYNAIFQRCMEFYKSEKLKKFIRKNM